MAQQLSMCVLFLEKNHEGWLTVAWNRRNPCSGLCRHMHILSCPPHTV